MFRFLPQSRQESEQLTFKANWDSLVDYVLGGNISLTLVKLLPISWAPALDPVVLAPVRAACVDLVVLVDRRLVLPIEERESVFLEYMFMFLCTKREASYMSQDFVMFFHASCEGLPGQ